MRSLAACYETLRAEIQDIPLVDCHDHTVSLGEKPADAASAVIDWYMRSDLQSASSDAEAARMFDQKLSLEERWPVLEKAWKRTRFTGYAEVVKRGMRHFYGEDDLTLEGLRRIGEKMLDSSDVEVHERVLDEAGILARLEDIFTSPIQPKLSPRGRLMISLPSYHAVCSAEDVRLMSGDQEKAVTSLEEYEAACLAHFTLCAKNGAVGFKDQSAYTRTLEYGNPSRAEAEAAFNWIMADPRRRLSYPDGNKPLGDYLFHGFMRAARDLNLPVQIHTGHMAGIRNDVRKANAAGLTSLLELHRDTRFDLFHANWPYSGDLLFLAKNYPNVAIDFCWTNMVDPVYAQNMFKQAISSVPHAKIHGYGTDLAGESLSSLWAHADLARENIAIALADLVEAQYLGMDDAREIAHAWLCGNANAFFRLGLEKV